MLLNIQERETRVKFNLGLSANRPSNNWALDNTREFLLFCMGQQPSLTKKYLCLIFSVNLRLKN